MPFAASRSSLRFRLLAIFLAGPPELVAEAATVIGAQLRVHRKPAEICVSAAPATLVDRGRMTPQSLRKGRLTNAVGRDKVVAA